MPNKYINSVDNVFGIILRQKRMETSIEPSLLRYRLDLICRKLYCDKALPEPGANIDPDLYRLIA